MPHLPKDLDSFSSTLEFGLADTSLHDVVPGALDLVGVFLPPPKNAPGSDRRPWRVDVRLQTWGAFLGETVGHPPRWELLDVETIASLNSAKRPSAALEFSEWMRLLRRAQVAKVFLKKCVAF